MPRLRSPPLKRIFNRVRAQSRLARTVTPHFTNVVGLETALNIVLKQSPKTLGKAQIAYAHCV